ncbi:MAG: ribonuclease P protein component [Casimicrobiaceae bacterium]
MASAKRHRLAGAAAFATLFREGRRSAARHVQLLAVAASGEVGRVGYVIGKQQLPRSVDRNYVRRMMREAVRLRRPAVSRYDIVLRLRASCKRVALPGLAREAAELLDALIAPSQP